MTITTDPNHPGINKPLGPGEQNEAYIVLSEEERAKGFIRPVRGSYLHAGKSQSGCGTVTTMPAAIAETYARDPSYYGSTWCCACKKHLPVSEFRWLDGQTLGT